MSGRLVVRTYWNTSDGTMIIKYFNNNKSWERGRLTAGWLATATRTRPTAGCYSWQHPLYDRFKWCVRYGNNFQRGLIVDVCPWLELYWCTWYHNTISSSGGCLRLFGEQWTNIRPSSVLLSVVHLSRAHVLSNQQRTSAVCLTPSVYILAKPQPVSV